MSMANKLTRNVSRAAQRPGVLRASVSVTRTPGARSPRRAIAGMCAAGILVASTKHTLSIDVRRLLIDCTVRERGERRPGAASAHSYRGKGIVRWRAQPCKALVRKMVYAAPDRVREHTSAQNAWRTPGVRGVHFRECYSLAHDDARPRSSSVELHATWRAQ